MTPLYEFSGKNNRFFSYVTRSASKFINMFLLRMKLTIVGSEKIPKDKNIVFIHHINHIQMFCSFIDNKKTSCIYTKKRTFSNL